MMLLEDSYAADDESEWVGLIMQGFIMLLLMRVSRRG